MGLPLPGPPPVEDPALLPLPPAPLGPFEAAPPELPPAFTP